MVVVWQAPRKPGHSIRCLASHASTFVFLSIYPKFRSLVHFVLSHRMTSTVLNVASAQPLLSLPPGAGRRFEIDSATEHAVVRRQHECILPCNQSL